jgi:hypothetical protein
VTANPTVMVDTSVKDYLGGDKALEMESKKKTTEMKVSFAALVHTESEPPFTGSSAISFVFSGHVYVLACIIDCFEKNEEKRRRKEG